MGKPISVQGIQKKIEIYEIYVRKSGLMSRVIGFATPWPRSFSTPMVTLLPSRVYWGHGQITTTQHYYRVAKLKVQRERQGNINPDFIHSQLNLYSISKNALERNAAIWSLVTRS